MENSREKDVIHRELDRGADSPAVAIAEAVADIEGKDATDLANMYDCIDGIVDHLFSEPPSSEARLQVEFDYEGYRITIGQDGSAQFMKTD